MDTKGTMTFDTWFDRLQALAYSHGVDVVDNAEWRESYDEGKTFTEAFYSEKAEPLDTPA